MNELLTERQLNEYLYNMELEHKLVGQIEALSSGLEKGIISASTEEGKFILNENLNFLKEQYAKVNEIVTQYNSINAELEREKERIRRELDDEWGVKPETIAAIEELTNQYREKCIAMDTPQISSENEKAFI